MNMPRVTKSMSCVTGISDPFSVVVVAWVTSGSGSTPAATSESRAILPQRSGWSDHGGRPLGSGGIGEEECLGDYLENECGVTRPEMGDGTKPPKKILGVGTGQAIVRQAGTKGIGALGAVSERMSCRPIRGLWAGRHRYLPTYSRELGFSGVDGCRCPVLGKHSIQLPDQGGAPGLHRCRAMLVRAVLSAMDGGLKDYVCPPR